MASVLAVCVVSSLRPDAGMVGITAIDKRAVEGPVKVGRYGLYADVQTDRKNHGGFEQAVYAYSQDDADYWGAELGSELWPGFFGENLRVDGLDLGAARVGERWRVGGSILEVTKPRTPCQTFARWVGAAVEGADDKGWVKRFSAARRLGVYLSVVQTGALAAGDDIELVHVPADAPTVLDIYRGV
jgi:MOSC domain-containing protein YiiM